MSATFVRSDRSERAHPSYPVTDRSRLLKCACRIQTDFFCALNELRSAKAPAASVGHPSVRAAATRDAPPADSMDSSDSESRAPVRARLPFAVTVTTGSPPATIHIRGSRIVSDAPLMRDRDRAPHRRAAASLRRIAARTSALFARRLRSRCPDNYVANSGQSWILRLKVSAMAPAAPLSDAAHRCRQLRPKR